MPLNSYISLYEAGEGTDEEKKIPLIDTIEPVVENNPETLYFGREMTEVFVEELKGNLSALENHVLYLHLMGTDYKTIAELLGKSPKAIDNALQRIQGKGREAAGKIAVFLPYIRDEDKAKSCISSDRLNCYNEIDERIW